MSLGQGRMPGVMTENMSLIRQNDLDLWHVGTKSQQKELKEIPLLCLTSMKETDGETKATTEDSPWQVFPSSFSLRPGGHLQ